MRLPRRSISIKGLSYQRLEGHCRAENKAIAGVLEVWIHDYLDRKGHPSPPDLVVDEPGPAVELRRYQPRRPRSDKLAQKILERTRACGAVHLF